MLSNKSQYILSKIGIPLYKEAKGLTLDHEMPVHFFQKDNILTLHANPVEEYNQKEQNLLEAIINSIASNSRASFTGQLVCHQGKQTLLSKKVDNSNDLKITIAFLNVERFSFDIDYIQSPSLLDMIKDTELKKNLWSKLKSFQKD